MNNIKINFQNLFKLLNDKDYVVVKLDPNFPEYVPGQDIDIYCRNIEETSRVIISFLTTFINNNRSINIQKRKNQIYIDLINNKKIHFRFDLYDDIPQYSAINIKSSFFDVMIESAQEKKIKDFFIKVPNELDETILRYIEYLEYISVRPDKIKHLDYIKSRFEFSNIDKEIFFSRFNHFTKFPQKSFEKKNIFFKLKMSLVYVYDLFSKIIIILKKNGLIFLIKKILGKTFDQKS